MKWRKELGYNGFLKFELIWRKQYVEWIGRKLNQRKGDQLEVFFNDLDYRSNMVGCVIGSRDGVEGMDLKYKM